MRTPRGPMDAFGRLPRLGRLPFPRSRITPYLHSTTFTLSQYSGNLNCVAPSYEGC